MNVFVKRQSNLTGVDSAGAGRTMQNFNSKKEHLAVQSVGMSSNSDYQPVPAPVVQGKTIPPM
jgi:hypothetical protein